MRKCFVSTLLSVAMLLSGCQLAIPEEANQVSGIPETEDMIVGMLVTLDSVEPKPVVNEEALHLIANHDFIAKSRIATQDVGEVPRIVNMLLTLLDEYDAPGLVIATTNLKVTLDEALFRRFDDVIEIPMPTETEIVQLLQMTLSAVPVDSKVDLKGLAKKLQGYSAANVVSAAQNAAKYAVLSGLKYVSSVHFEQALAELTKF